VLRKIIHIDMDAFFASVEQRDNPDLKGKPVAVGGSKERGVVAAASYEARKFGVRSAMASSVAYRKCPNLIFVRPRFEVYKAVSMQIRQIFMEYTELIEPLSLDEAYLDVTENKKNMPFAMDIAEEIRAKIFLETNLTCSAGISYNKFLAKCATEINKPNGMFVITPQRTEKFIDQLPIEKFFGVGKVTAEKMRKKGITNGFELKQKSKIQLQQWFGKAGSYYFHVARGEDFRAVNPDRIRKSIGAENTYSQDLNTINQLKIKLEDIYEVLIRRLRANNAFGRTITLKVKYADFSQITRSKSSTDFLTETDIDSYSEQLLQLIPNIEKGVRLLGLQISNFDQLDSEPSLGQLELIF
jgi:DNA polymerase IV